ncbi:Hypothetical protein LUCI_0634 [Lucifera butyrica]|uniref:Uncharacterized protein n=1 Tax=Lucifera butyrica TaxID=1351585 RepID=A0A498R2P4_9FIRM|nr:hypothetical protein [Lucifera butyrica]VBB05425.1 Hypothetical protein LUCI_0634 [Lucifera butyrica]
MNYFFNSTPYRQYIVFDTGRGCVGYGWPTCFDNYWCRRRYRRHCHHYRRFGGYYHPGYRRFSYYPQFPLSFMITDCGC